MKTFILIPIVLFTLFSCEKEKGEVYCASAAFIFLNANGEDLFDKDTPGSLDVHDFKVCAEDSISRLNFIDSLSDKKIFDIWIRGAVGKDGVTYLKFGDINIDTIYAKFKERGNSLFISELYYNGKLLEKNENVSQCGTKVHEITILED